MNRMFRLICICLTVSGPFLALSSRALAQSDEDRKILLMYYKEDELVVESATRSQKSITQTAENVTIVTAEDIKLMNAHTVADVLNAVNGMQVFMTGGPGSIAPASIQGSDNRHVAVFMDGIPLNNLSDNVTDLATLPVQNIQKIEIIKGPASSAWGSALGGVVNIITKSGAGNRTGGVVSASYGERNTGDLRLETSGKRDRIGYYITAGRLETDGFRAHNDFFGNNAYAKLTYDLTARTSVLFSIGYDKIERGTIEIPDIDLFINNNVETVRTAFSVKSKINKETEVDLSFWNLHSMSNVNNYQLSTGDALSTDRYDDNGYGSSVKLTWKPKLHNVVLGADFDSKKLESNTIADGKQGLKKSAYYINDTMSFERLSITPGIRFDKTDTNGEFTSPSLGVTYKLADATLLRAYSARGFSIPPFSATYGDNIFHVSNPGLKMERVWSYQLGAETTAFRYLWLKLSAFRHDIKDVIVNEGLSATTFMAVNGGRQRRQGMEIEVKTAPVYHLSFFAGGAFMNTKDLDTGEVLPNAPQRTYDLGLQYDKNSLKALLKGHYVYWNADQSFEGKYDTFIFDANVVKNITLRDKQALEIFVEGHNIFNGLQYPAAAYRNPGRWLEAGVRFVF
jgi:vitamin B12 transporter